MDESKRESIRQEMKRREANPPKPIAYPWQHVMRVLRQGNIPMVRWTGISP